MPGGIAIDVRVREQSKAATIGFLTQYGNVVKRDLIQATISAGERTRSLAYFYAPVDTSFMRDHLHVLLSKQGFAFQVGYDESDFAGQRFYAVDQELGFTHWLSGAFIQNAHLRPAFEITSPEYLADVHAILQSGIRKARARAA